MNMFQNATTCEGGTEARRKVLEFLTKVAEGMETEGEIKVVLHQVAKGGEQAIAEDVYDFADPLEQFASELIDEAEKDAMDIGRGKIKYSLRVAGKNARCTFALTVPENEDSDLDDIDEVPNRKGIISQQMRHTEAAWGTTRAVVKDAQELLHRTIRDQAARIQVLERQALENVKLYEDLFNMKFARDLELAKLQKSEMRKDQVGHVLMQGLPIVMAKLLGGGQKAAVEMMGSKTPLEQMLEAFLGTFNREQLEKIMVSGVLSPPQIAAFGEILTYVMDRHEKEQEMFRGKQNGVAQHGAAPQESQPAQGGGAA